MFDHLSSPNECFSVININIRYVILVENNIFRFSNINLKTKI